MSYRDSNRQDADTYMGWFQPSRQGRWDTTRQDNRSHTIIILSRFRDNHHGTPVHGIEDVSAAYGSRFDNRSEKDLEALLSLVIVFVLHEHPCEQRIATECWDSNLMSAMPRLDVVCVAG